MGEEKNKNVSTSSGTSLGSSMSIKNQQRLSLETTWKSLDLERQHFLKLMALNEKLLRSRQEKREDRMSRIRSHLTVPQIARIERERRRTEELRKRSLTVMVDNCGGGGGGGSDRGINSGDGGGGGGGGGKMRDASQDEVDGRASQQYRSIQSSLSNPGYSKLKSFYGHERSESREVRTVEHGRERVSLSEEKVNKVRERSSQSAPKTRAKSVEWKIDVQANKTHPPKAVTIKPGCTDLSESSPNMEKEGTTLSALARTSRLRSSSSSSSPSTFSCHEERKRNAERRRSQSVGSPVLSNTPPITSSSTSNSSTTSVFHDAIEAIKKERTRSDLRNLMVIENDLQYMQLQHRKEVLMADIADLVKRDHEFAQRRRMFLPPTDPTKVSLTSLSQAELMQSGYDGVDITDLRKEIRRRKNERMRDRMKVDIPADQLKRKENETEEEYSKRIEKWWRDMRKVRYLRRTSTRQDLSDVVTLAMAQQNNNKIWRQSLRDNLF